MAIDFGIKDRVIGADTHVISVSGEVDLFTAPEFKQRVMAPIAAGVEHVIVHLTGTTFVDTSGLGVIFFSHRRLKSILCCIVVACTSEAIVKTFRITGLDGVFTIVDSVEAGLRIDAEAA
jgi:anti-sigma B factor antagonist